MPHNFIDNNTYLETAHPSKFQLVIWNYNLAYLLIRIHVGLEITNIICLLW